jgi:hypothetical protein
MKRKNMLFMIFIFALSLFVVPIVNSEECVELKYDDGTWETALDNQINQIGYQVGVKFSLPQNWAKAKIVTAKSYPSRPNQF